MLNETDNGKGKGLQVVDRRHMNADGTEKKTTVAETKVDAPKSAAPEKKEKPLGALQKIYQKLSEAKTDQARRDILRKRVEVIELLEFNQGVVVWQKQQAAAMDQIAKELRSTSLALSALLGALLQAGMISDAMLIESEKITKQESEEARKLATNKKGDELRQDLIERAINPALVGLAGPTIEETTLHFGSRAPWWRRIMWRILLGPNYR